MGRQSVKVKRSLYGLAHATSCILLALYEIFLMVTHYLVLRNVFEITNMDGFERKLYFCSDLLAVIFAYLLIGNKNWFLSLVHFVVHATACMHLFGFESYFYAEVFKLAESIPSTFEISTIYYILTSEDILCHAVNVYLLTNMALFGISYKTKKKIA
jgi:hypothetical protein